MNKKTVRTISYMFICSICLSAFTGCAAVPSLELTEEQSSLIAEYAAGKLIEYVKGHPGGLMILEDVDRADVNPGMKKTEQEETLPPLPEQLPQPESQPQPVSPPDIEQPDDVSGNDQSGQDALVDAPASADVAPTKSIAEALGIAGAMVTYNRYEITPTYPENAVELAFSMKAASGKELLVVHFDLSNPGGDDIDAFTDSSNFKVRLLVNGSDKIRGDVTFLDNDLMNYRGILPSGSSVDSVLVFEIPKETEVTSMDLLIVTDDSEQKYKLL